MTIEEASRLLLNPARRPPLSEVETALLMMVVDLSVKHTELYLMCMKSRK